jgi:hypothetical protein
MVWDSSFITTFTVTIKGSEVMQERMDSFILMHFWLKVLKHLPFKYYCCPDYDELPSLLELYSTYNYIKHSYFIYSNELSQQCYLIGRSVRWPGRSC